MKLFSQYANETIFPCSLLGFVQMRWDFVGNHCLRIYTFSFFDKISRRGNNVAQTYGLSFW